MTMKVLLKASNEELIIWWIELDEKERRKYVLLKGGLLKIRRTAHTVEHNYT
jgi:hypothetical protein